jgi:hypothetical protein
MTSIVESTEMLLYDACKTKGFSWTKVSPLWTTWPLEKFGKPSNPLLYSSRTNIYVQ